MEGHIVAADNRQSDDSNLVSKSMGSSIKIDSISIDLVNANDKNDAENCEHFSIRAFVSEIRKRDWTKCWPFLLDDNNKKSEETCMLPPLDVPKFRQWHCENCLREIGAQDAANNHQTFFNSCSSGSKSNGVCSHLPAFDDVSMLLSDFQKTLKLDGLDGKNGDANTSRNLNSGDCHLLLCSDKKEKNIELARSPIIGNDIGSENVNSEIAQLFHAPTDAVSCLMPENHHTDDTAFKSKCNGSIKSCKPSGGHYKAADIDVADGNLNCTIRKAPEICLMGKAIPADDRYKNLMMASEAFEKAGFVDETLNADNCIKSRNHSREFDESESSESAENNFEDHHDAKSSGLHRKKMRKVRLLTDLLCRNGDVDGQQSRLEGSPNNAVADASPGGDMLFSPDGGVVAVQENGRRNSCQNEKRELPQDEEWRLPEMSTPNNAYKKVKIAKGEAETAKAIAVSGLEGDEFSGLGLQTGLKNQWAKRATDRTPIIGKKKNKKTQIDDESLLPAPSQESIPNNSQAKFAEASKVSAADDVLLMSVPSAFPDKRMDLFPFPAQRMERKSNLCKKKGKERQVDSCASIIPWNNGMVKEDLMTGKGVEILQRGPLALPCQTEQDAITESELNLSLNSYSARQLTWQEGIPKEDHLMKRDLENKLIGDSSFLSESSLDALSGKPVHQHLSSKRTTYRMPFMNEKQSHNSQVDVRGHSLMQQMEFFRASKNGKTTETYEHLPVSKKDSEVSEQIASDDIPMEIVELMAKNQYERCLPDAENDEQQLFTAQNTRNARIMDFNKSHGHGSLRSFEKETTQKRKPWARNGIIKGNENVGPSKQKPIDFISQIDRQHFNISQLEQTHIPAGFRPFPQCQVKPSSAAQFSATSSSKHSSAQNCKWIEDMMRKGPSCASLQTSRACSTCQSVPQQSEEGAYLCSSIIPNHIPLIYNIPQKCTTPSANVDILSHGGSFHKGNVNGDQDLTFLNLNTIDPGKHSRKIDSESLSRARAEYPYPIACKHSGIELHQRMMGSLDLYSNETIPAMHLLSLMDAGLQSGAPMNMDGPPKFLKRPSILHDHYSKEVPRLDSGVYRTTNTMKQPSYDHYSKNHLLESSLGCYSAIPTVGASASSFHGDKHFMKAPKYSEQVSSKFQEKETKTGSARNRHCGSQKFVSAVSGSGTNCGSIPVHSMQKVFLEASDSRVLPLQFYAMEKSGKHAIEVPGTSGTVWPVRSGSETQICTVNRNPADFSMPVTGNVYMIGAEDLRFGRAFPYKSSSALIKMDGRKRQRKPAAVKEHAQLRIS